MKWVLPILLLAAPALGRPKPEAAQYLDELERRGLVDKSVATPEKLAAEVQAASSNLVAGEIEKAAARLYAIVEAPRWQDFSDSDDFQDAEYRLGLALAKGGSSNTARKYLLRSISRGQKAPFFEAALRAYTDSCLDERVVPACVEELDKLPPPDPHQEIAYLRGRAAFDAGDLKAAEEELSRVGTRSRFYSSALYLRGVGKVKRGDIAGAKDAFCVVAGPPEHPAATGKREPDTLRFFIDGRYYQVRDLARLALGRLAHEERKYDDAFYHYFLIPQDSSKLGDALFEAAWSSLERREYDLGARLVEEFLKLYENSERAWEARLLHASLQVKTCRFAEAQKGFTAFLKEYEPLVGAVDRALADPAQLSALTARLVAKVRGQESRAGDATTAALAALLAVDARFSRLALLARGLETGAADSAHVADSWRALEGKLGERVQATGVDAARLYERVNELGRLIARARGKVPEGELAKLEARRQALKAELRVAALEHGETTTKSWVHADSAAAARLRDRVNAMRDKLESASAELVRVALIELRGRLEQLLKRARLGQIDAAVGEKRKLERQIEDLAAGRFPPELFGKLHLEGLIADDEEYWPPEKEYWADEYEGYK